jgi:hypothetical protein
MRAIAGKLIQWVHRIQRECFTPHIWCYRAPQVKQTVYNLANRTAAFDAILVAYEDHRFLDKSLAFIYGSTKLTLIHPAIAKTI